MKNVVVIDAQNDFITGALACIDGKNVAQRIAKFISGLDESHNIFYTQDWHGIGHCSFVSNGGIWVTHCVAGTLGAAIFSDFRYLGKNSPNELNTYKKAQQDYREEYSCNYAINSAGIPLYCSLQDQYLNTSTNTNTDKYSVILVGFATEFCVFESAVDFKKNGFDVTVVENLCGYVSKEGHIKAIEKMRQAGIHIINV